MSRQPSTTRGRATVPVLLVILAVIVGGGVWYGHTRIQRLNEQLAESDKHAEEMSHQLREYSAELEVASSQARAAADRADTAEQQVEQTTDKLRETERQVQEAERQIESVAAEREHARRDASQTREELEAVQRRRAAELDRMQEALNRVAPTKRTPAGMVMVLGDEHFRFDFDKATLKPDNREVLSRIAGILMASEGYRLFIDGHTDDVGTETYNVDLSQRRAAAVRDYLVDAGIPEELIKIHGYGKMHPLVDAKTKDARAANRRVEIGIVDTIVHYENAVEN